MINKLKEMFLKMGGNSLQLPNSFDWNEFHELQKRRISNYHVPLKNKTKLIKTENLKDEILINLSQKRKRLPEIEWIILQKPKKLIKKE